MSRPVLVVLGLAVMLLLYETVGKNLVAWVTIVGVLGLLLRNETTIRSQFSQVVRGTA